MCGRAAQTNAAVQLAAASLGLSANKQRLEFAENFKDDDNEQTSSVIHISEDNYNMSPGMDAVVFWKDADDQEIRMGKKVWGLIPRGGTPLSPLPEGMNKHFQGLMYNARSDTLFEKTTFSRLVNSGKTCLVAFDGFFEWKTELKGKKQPYFVFPGKEKNENNETLSNSNDRPYLLMAGLWTSVSTGNKENPTLDTFTILTTEACKPLEWLHNRMPVTIWDENNALRWLDCPSQCIHRTLEEEARQTPDGYLNWHPVTTEMSSMKFRSEKAIKPVPKLKTVKSYFTTVSKDKANDFNKSQISIASSGSRERPAKRVAPDSATSKQSCSPTKKLRKGSIQSFFKPKKSM